MGNFHYCICRLSPTHSKLLCCLCRWPHGIGWNKFACLCLCLYYFILPFPSPLPFPVPLLGPVPLWLLAVSPGAESACSILSLQSIRSMLSVSHFMFLRGSSSRNRSNSTMSACRRFEFVFVDRKLSLSTTFRTSDRQTRGQ